MPCPPEKPSVYIETYGCQMNVLDSELVQDQFEALGYRFVDNQQDARVVLLNTCSVRDRSEHKVWSKLGRLLIQKRERPDMIVGVLGCMAERVAAEITRRAPHVDVVCGPSNLDGLAGLVDNALLNRGGKAQLSLAGHRLNTARRSKTPEAAYSGLDNLDLSRAFSPTGSQTQAYVRITRGCNKFCAFCVVPFTRGPEVHRAPEHIVDEVRKLVKNGVVEVTLIGQTVNHYAYTDGGRTTSFADLLWRVHEQVPDLPRLRFITSYPRDFTDAALDVMAASPRICRYLHVPAQSGSDRMLRAMNRGYTVDEYLGLLQRARDRMPDIRLAGDMIVGFCGETDADHQASVELLRQARYKSCFVFKYSPRSGTVAHRRLPDDVSDQLKKARNLDLLEVQAELSQQHNRQKVGETLPVIVEGFGKQRTAPPPNGVTLGWTRRPSTDWLRLRGRTEGDEIVAFDGPETLVGQLTEVVAEDATPLTILGRWRPSGVRQPVRASGSPVGSSSDRRR